MEQEGKIPVRGTRIRTRLLRSTCFAPLAAAVVAIGAAPEVPVTTIFSAVAETAAKQLPAPPANGVMGFVVNRFVPSVIPGEDACPTGPAPRNRVTFLNNLPPEERERIQKKENEAEFNQRWRTSMSRPDGSNICSQYSQFPERPLMPAVQSKFAWGLNLDGDEGDGSSNPEGCVHQNFISPDGEKGIDNQVYRALGCVLEYRGADGTSGELAHAMYDRLSSGEWTQVLLLRGVDSLMNDDNVEIIYGNTPDRPVVDSTGKFIQNVSYTISVEAPRERNMLRGRIVNGVLITESQDIKLAENQGTGAARDTRAARARWDLRKARLRLAFQPDGTLKGILGGYRRIDDLNRAQQLGGMGTAFVAGIDCAGEYNTLKKLADGIRDPKTGQCTSVSTGIELTAIPAFVNDVRPKRKIASN